MCLNFVQGGGCYATGGRCLLGLQGASAKNHDGGCELHGKFDVWLNQQNGLLITDLGFPSEEPKQCLALGINENLARKIAEDRARQLGSSVVTTERRCFKCEKNYWISEHADLSGFQEIGRGCLCPRCINAKGDQGLEEKLGVLRYWCG